LGTAAHRPVRSQDSSSKFAQGTDLKEKATSSLKRLRDLIASQIIPSQTLVGWRVLARTFLKLGFTGFGGGIAVIAQIRRIVVHEQRWLSDEEFLDAVSLAQSLPGANSANTITYVGLRLAGIQGAVISLASFVFPSFLMMIGLSIAHDHFHHLLDVQRLFQGLSAAVVGLIAATAVRLGRTAMSHQWHLELGVATAFVLIFMGVSISEVVLLAGMIGIFVQSFKVRVQHRMRLQLHKQRQSGARTATATRQARQLAEGTITQKGNLAVDHTVGVSLPVAAHGEEESGPQTKAREQSPMIPIPNDPVDLNSQPDDAPSIKRLRGFAIPFLTLPFFLTFLVIWQLAMVFLRVGSVTFGGGFVMIPQIETDVVNVHRWLTKQDFADGVVFGQITPGPVLITATYVGYKVASLSGAIVATVAAFLPSFLMTLIAGASLNRFRTNHQVQAFLAGVAPAVVGMLIAAAVSMGRSGLHSTLSFGVATLAFLMMLRAKFNPLAIIFACGLLQFAVSRFLN
jgi:chromate transporter